MNLENQNRVGKTPIRYRQDGFDLDLALITDRLIAMSFPGNGFEVLYRNSINDVADFLNKNFGKQYSVINLSNRTYDKSKFNHNVYDLHWNDHMPCPFRSLVRAVLDCCDFLAKDSTRCLAVHCLAGKGRTGSFICCILMVTGLHDNAHDANQFYLARRGINVTNPCQLRYLEYFQAFLHRGVAAINLSHTKIKKIFFKTTDSDFIRSNVFHLRIKDISTDEVILNE